jgi:hypothetical protein
MHRHDRVRYALGSGIALSVALSFVLVLAAARPLTRAASAAAPRVELVKTPDGGIQPQALVDGRGVTHLVYLKGDPKAADIYYTRRDLAATTWSTPLRVNDRSGSAVAVGTIRGAQLAVGKGGRIHVVWFGSDQSQTTGSRSRGAPLLYSRLNDQGTAFEPARNMMQLTSALDGGPSVAADTEGNVYVAWHGQDGASDGEAARRLWVARSTDEGKSFSREAPAWAEPTGACACCGARAYADRRGSVYVLYRAATANVERDMILLTSLDHGRSFQGTRLHRWKLNACPMSSEAFAESASGVLAAWETKGQVYFARIDPMTGKPSRIIAAPGDGGEQKHPSLAAAADGSTLLAWTEGTGWERGGSLAWQTFSAAGEPIGMPGRMKGAVPVWSLATVAARRDGSFTLVY